jgi:hypothetical protein
VLGICRSRPIGCRSCRGWSPGLNIFANINWPNEEARSAAADWLHIKLLTDLEQLDALDEAEPLGQA